MERTCGPEEWTCKSKNGQCIPNAWVCDDHEDCDDKSDEEVCSKYISSKSNFYLISYDLYVYTIVIMFDFLQMLCYFVFSF